MNQDIKIDRKTNEKNIQHVAKNYLYLPAKNTVYEEAQTDLVSEEEKQV